MQSNAIIVNSGVLFGTSGARGLVSQLTPEVCAAFAINFAQLMQQSRPIEHIGLGIDNRPSSYAMAQACAAAIKTLGIQPLYFGVLPTPALASYCMANNMPCIMVTGSHIPFDRNGLKFYRPDGEISKADESLIVEGEYPVPEDTALSELPANPEANQHYLARFQDYFPAGFLTGKTIGIYQHSSAGRDLYANLFEHFGASTVALGRSDHFVPIDTEAVSEQDRNQAITWSKEYQLDALFSTD
ncbi:MAG: phosphomannomutase, partial [Alkalimonas sp.]|nr:phosphomannomutase [Alkalimonas sp.]